MKENENKSEGNGKIKKNVGIEGKEEEERKLIKKREERKNMKRKREKKK